MAETTIRTTMDDTTFMLPASAPAPSTAKNLAGAMTAAAPAATAVADATVKTISTPAVNPSKVGFCVDHCSDDELAPDTVISKSETYDKKAALWFLLKATAADLGPQWAAKPPAEFDQLKKQVSLWHMEKGRVQYRLGKRAAADGAGRLYAAFGRGLQCFPRPLRGLLAAAYYWDIDMVNAQPVLLLQYAKKQGWACVALQEYVDNKEAYFATIMKDGMSRDDAKAACIAIFFGQGEAKTREADLPPFFVKRLQPEIAKMHDNMFNHSEHAALRRSLTRATQLKRSTGEATTSVKLSLVAYVLQTFERKCLLAIERELVRNDREMDTYIHDGGLVRKLDGEEDFPLALLAQCEAAVLADTGYIVKLVVKPMSTTVVVPEGAIEAMQPTHHLDAWQNQYRVAYIETRNMYSYWNATTRSLQLVEKAHLVNIFENHTFEKMQDDKIKFVSTTKEWLAWTDRATYGDAGFWPSNDARHARAGVLNTFSGCAYEAILADEGIIAAAADSEGVIIVEELLLYVCGGVKESTYFQMVLAVKLQHPQTPPRLNIVFNGPSGVGKDTVCDWIGESVFGKPLYFSTKNAQRDVFGPFNGLTENKLLIKLEETEAATFSGVWERVKSAVTSGNQQINNKGKEVRDVDSFVLWMMTTNRESVPVESDDRRNVVFQAVERAHKQDAAWFTRVHSALAQPAVVKYFVQKWLQTDITGFDLIAHRPVSRLHEAACAAAVPRVMQFLGTVVNGGYVTVSLASLFESYNDWHRVEHTNPAAESKATFNSRLRTARGVGGAPLVGDENSATLSPLVETRTSQERGWRVDRTLLREWLEAKGYLAKEAAGVTMAHDDVAAPREALADGCQPTAWLA